MPLAVGEPADGYPFRWYVSPWLEGTNPTPDGRSTSAGWPSTWPRSCSRSSASTPTARPTPGPASAADRSPAPTSHPCARRAAARRDRRRRAARGLGRRPCTRRRGTARRCGSTATWDGNLLVRDGRLSGVIDWGGLLAGDPAVELMVAWSLFDARARTVYRDALGFVDDAMWLRAAPGPPRPRSRRCPTTATPTPTSSGSWRTVREVWPTSRTRRGDEAVGLAPTVQPGADVRAHRRGRPSLRPILGRCVGIDLGQAHVPDVPRWPSAETACGPAVTRGGDSMSDDDLLVEQRVFYRSDAESFDDWLASLVAEHNDEPVAVTYRLGRHRIAATFESGHRWTRARDRGGHRETGPALPPARRVGRAPRRLAREPRHRGPSAACRTTARSTSSRPTSSRWRRRARRSTRSCSRPGFTTCPTPVRRLLGPRGRCSHRRRGAIRLPRCPCPPGGLTEVPETPPRHTASTRRSTASASATTTAGAGESSTTSGIPRSSLPGSARSDGRWTILGPGLCENMLWASAHR